MTEVRFNGEIDNLTVLIIFHNAKTFVITDLEDADNYVDMEEVNPMIENGEDAWIDDLTGYVFYLEGQGYTQEEE